MVSTYTAENNLIFYNNDQWHLIEIKQSSFVEEMYKSYFVGEPWPV